MNKLAHRLRQYAYLMRLDRPIGTYLLLWPTMWGMWLANNGQPTTKLVLIFALGAFIMRSAGCVVNDMADRNFDPHVERTKNRPLAAKAISITEAFIILILLLLIALILASFLNFKAILLAFVAAFLAISYPFMKRFHSLPQAHLGIAFGFSIPMAYAASINILPFECWFLFAINIIWALIYDTAYALCDQDDDIKIGVKSSALLLHKYLGDKEYLGIAVLQVMMLGMLIILGFIKSWGIAWWLTCACIAYIFYRHINLLKLQITQQSFQVFLDNNRIGWIILIGIILSLLP